MADGSTLPPAVDRATWQSAERSVLVAGVGWLGLLGR